MPATSTITIRDIDHVVIRARDIAAMTAFYCDVLGMALAKRNLKAGIVHLRAGRSMVDLMPISGDLATLGPALDPGQRNMDHFCLRVEPFDERAILAALAAHGVDAAAPVMRFGAEGDGRSIYLKDPEGNTVELKGPSTPT